MQLCARRKENIRSHYLANYFSHFNFTQQMITLCLLWIRGSTVCWFNKSYRLIQIKSHGTFPSIGYCQVREGDNWVAGDAAS